MLAAVDYCAAAVVESLHAERVLMCVVVQALKARGMEVVPMTVFARGAHWALEELVTKFCCLCVLELSLCVYIFFFLPSG